MDYKTALCPPADESIRNEKRFGMDYGFADPAMKSKPHLCGRAHTMMMQRYHEHETEVFEPKGKGGAPAKGGKAERRGGFDGKGRDSVKGREPFREPFRETFREPFREPFRESFREPLPNAGKGRGRPERPAERSEPESREHLEAAKGPRIQLNTNLADQGMLASLERQINEAKGTRMFLEWGGCMAT
ncbi:unnamed protein product [Symbiodinium pilosum]|uniref:Uncharacterized protein n=1 Tax=Symbiodinium pilosum TaxID=2952 RepID=A0A812KFI3_SYMPI|nr:unnamed protein product [Symbiodinium pilosum]